jgi:hypothetical protein
LPRLGRFRGAVIWLPGRSQSGNHHLLPHNKRVASRPRVCCAPRCGTLPPGSIRAVAEVPPRSSLLHDQSITALAAFLTGVIRSGRSGRASQRRSMYLAFFALRCESKERIRQVREWPRTGRQKAYLEPVGRGFIIARVPPPFQAVEPGAASRRSSLNSLGARVSIEPSAVTIQLVKLPGPNKASQDESDSNLSCQLQSTYYNCT